MAVVKPTYPPVNVEVVCRIQTSDRRMFMSGRTRARDLTILSMLCSTGGRILIN